MTPTPRRCKPRSCSPFSSSTACTTWSWGALPPLCMGRLEPPSTSTWSPTGPLQTWSGLLPPCGPPTHNYGSPTPARSTTQSTSTRYAPSRCPPGGPATILDRLDLPTMSSASRDLPRRQQTLWNAIDWSYELLDEPARRLFERLSVFAGGARLEEIETVCGPMSQPGWRGPGGPRHPGRPQPGRSVRRTR